MSVKFNFKIKLNEELRGSYSEELVPFLKLKGTKVAQFSNLKGIRFTQSVGMTGAGGETRTPNIQIRSLIGWKNKDKQG